MLQQDYQFSSASCWNQLQFSELLFSQCYLIHYRISVETYYNTIPLYYNCYFTSSVTTTYTATNTTSLPFLNQLVIATSVTVELLLNEVNRLRRLSSGAHIVYSAREELYPTRDEISSNECCMLNAVQQRWE